MATNFKGIRKNVKKVNNSLTPKNIERLQRKGMHKLYEDKMGNKRFIVVKAVEVDDAGDMTVGYQTVGLSPVVMVFGELDQEERELSVRKQKIDGTLKPGKEVKVGPDKTYRLYNNIVLVSFTGAESMYETARIKGLEIDNTIYYPASGSASMGKKSKVYFTSHNSLHQFNVMNNLTGDLLEEALEDLDETADFDTISGIASRISLCATTPSLWPKKGITSNVFYFHGSIKSKAEETNISKIDNNYRDGYAIISDRIGSEMVEELAGESVSNSQARRMSYQLRVRGAAGKGHFRAYSLAQRFKEIKMLMKIDITKCYCWEDGKRVNLTKLSEKEIVRLVAKIDIIADKDVFKWGKYMIKKDEISPLEIGIVNMSNETAGNMGTQIAFKLRDDVEDAIKYFAAITERQLVTSEAAEGSIRFESDTIRLANTAYHNCYNLAPERAMTDKLLNNFKIKQLDKMTLNRVANLKLSINSNYLRMVPEDHLLNDMKEVLGSHDVDFVMPTGEVQAVRCLEIYSPAFERQFFELKDMLDSNDKMTQKEKDIVLNNFRVAIAIKSPSQGDNEFEVFYLVLLEEIKQRGVTPEYLQFINECPNNCIILAQDNTVKHQLAGSDFDGDDITTIYTEVSMTEDGKLTTGLVYEGKVINDYTSLIVRKRVREGNIGYAALIVYNDNNPLRFTEEQEQTEEVETADYIKNMDISSLF